MSEGTSKGFLLIVSGPSGVGKGTILKEATAKCPDLWFSVSVTTRPPREGEIDGVHYFFIDNAQYDRMLAENALLEHADVHTARYGTPAKPIADACDAGKIAVLDIDTLGAEQIKACCPDAVSVFILPPSWKELERRLTGRSTETPQQVDKRLKNARAEVKKLSLYDYVIVNRDVSEAANELCSILQAEKKRVKRFNPCLLENMEDKDI